MKDLGIRQGSGAFAVPLVVMPDAVYVHTDIQKVEPQEGMETSGEVYQYHEYIYEPNEYIQLLGEQNDQLNSLVNGILGVSE